jgi:hypothetical protein
VVQRIFLSEGGFWERPAGEFHPEEGEQDLHFEDWTMTRLREVLAGGVVGAVLTEGTKTSFCLLDWEVFDLTLPGAPASSQYTDCEGGFQGISVGWSDVYARGIEGQTVSLCGIPDGTYWLESEVDPLDHVLETDETNNVTRVQVAVAIPAPPACNDGVDNDGDGWTDHPTDPGCYRLASRRENPACNDGIDNDADGLTDHPADPTCTAAWQASEGMSITGCGLGAELTALLPLLGRARRTRRAMLR